MLILILSAMKPLKSTSEFPAPPVLQHTQSALKFEERLKHIQEALDEIGRKLAKIAEELQAIAKKLVDIEIKLRELAEKLGVSLPAGDQAGEQSAGVPPAGQLIPVPQATDSKYVGNIPIPITYPVSLQTFCDNKNATVYILSEDGTRTMGTYSLPTEVTKKFREKDYNYWSNNSCLLTSMFGQMPQILGDILGRSIRESEVASLPYADGLIVRQKVMQMIMQHLHDKVPGACKECTTQFEVYVTESDFKKEMTLKGRDPQQIQEIKGGKGADKDEKITRYVLPEDIAKEFFQKAYTLFDEYHITRTFSTQTDTSKQPKSITSIAKYCHNKIDGEVVTKESEYERILQEAKLGGFIIKTEFPVEQEAKDVQKTIWEWLKEHWYVQAKNAGDFLRWEEAKQAFNSSFPVKLSRVVPDSPPELENVTDDVIKVALQCAAINAGFLYSEIGFVFAYLIGAQLNVIGPQDGKLGLTMFPFRFDAGKVYPTLTIRNRGNSHFVAAQRAD